MKNLHRNGVFDIEDIRSVVISLYSNGMFLWGIFFYCFYTKRLLTGEKIFSTCIRHVTNVSLRTIL